jgi:hypothetical protein
MIRVPVATFDNLSGASMTKVDMSVEELHEMAVHNRAAKKEDLPPPGSPPSAIRRADIARQRRAGASAAPSQER